MPILFHRTTELEARKILARGFLNGPANGVWLMTYPSAAERSKVKEVLLSVDVPFSTDELFYKYEIHGSLIGCRQFLVPAEALCHCQICLQDGNVSESWNEYPESEPESMRGQIELAQYRCGFALRS